MNKVDFFQCTSRHGCGTIHQMEGKCKKCGRIGSLICKACRETARYLRVAAVIRHHGAGMRDFDTVDEAEKWFKETRRR